MIHRDTMVKKEDQVATITLNRPQKMNGLTYRMLEELIAALDDIAADHNVRVAVITGAGRAFCAGADLRLADLREGKVLARDAEDLNVEIRAAGGARGRLTPIVAKAIFAIRDLEKPVIAMINGDVVGGGFGIALACDMRVVQRDARMMIGYPRIGFVPDMGELWMLPRVVGFGRALEIMMTSEFISAEEAYRIGLVNRIAAPDQLQDETMKLAESVIKIPPITQRLIKQGANSALEVDPRTSMQFGYTAALILMGAKDNAEAFKAFAERRAPVYDDTPLYEGK